MTINNQFELKEIVFLITDTDQSSRIITAIQISISGGLIYRLACGTSESWHYEYEMARDKKY